MKLGPRGTHLKEREIVKRRKGCGSESKWRSLPCTGDRREGVEADAFAGQNIEGVHSYWHHHSA